jgi:hypothetical protein
MKKRYVYSLLFGIPGFFVSGIISLVVFGSVIGILWIYVFGDDPWPLSTDTVLSILVVVTFLLLWITSIIIGYGIGKKLEIDPVLNRKHILVSGTLTIIFVLFIVLQQLSVGNIGPRSESVLCSDFCVQHGYAGSGIPPENSGDRSCSCYDSSGNEVLKVPLDSIKSDSSK